MFIRRQIFSTPLANKKDASSYAILSQTLPYLAASELEGKYSAKTCSDIKEGYHLTQKVIQEVIISLWKRRLLLNHLINATMDDFIYGIHQEQRLGERKLEYGLMKPTSVIGFASFLEPNSDAFHGPFSFIKIAVIISNTSAAFQIWN